MYLARRLPLRSGQAVGDGDRSAQVIGATEWIRTGEVTVFCLTSETAGHRVIVDRNRH